MLQFIVSFISIDFEFYLLPVCLSPTYDYSYSDIPIRSEIITYVYTFKYVLTGDVQLHLSTCVHALRLRTSSLPSSMVINMLVDFLH